MTFCKIIRRKKKKKKKTTFCTYSHRKKNTERLFRTKLLKCSFPTTNKCQKVLVIKHLGVSSCFSPSQSPRKKQEDRAIRYYLFYGLASPQKRITATIAYALRIVQTFPKSITFAYYYK